MGLSYEEYLPKLIEAQSKINIARIENERIKVGIKAQLHELLSDPRWSIYSQQIENNINNENNTVTNLSARLLEGLEPDVYVKALAEYRYHLGVKSGLEIALALIRDTVKA